MRQSWETMTSVSAGHIILTPTQPVGSGQPKRGSNPGPPHQESRTLPQSYRARPPSVSENESPEIKLYKQIKLIFTHKRRTRGGGGGGGGEAVHGSQRDNTLNTVC